MANIANTQQKGLAPTKPVFSAFLSQQGIKNLIEQSVGKNAQRFTTSIISAVSNNPALQDCDHATILSAALIGESLGLSPSPQLGQYYLVPYDDRKNCRKVAQFQIGYKGYIQLAIRSGQYKKLNVLEIKEGELVRFDPINEEITLNLIEDEELRENTPTIGYYAMFEYVNGFRKVIYWSYSKMLNHADRYSQAFTKDGGVVKTRYGEKKKVSYRDYKAGNYNKEDDWLYSSDWYQNFDAMAMKTMLRQLISKWGIMSIEMQQAFDADSAVFDGNGAPSYIDFGQPTSVDETPMLRESDVPKPTAEEQATFDFFSDGSGGDK